MSEIINLIDKEAVKKIREIIDNQKICMFATNLREAPFSVCPMTAKEVEEEGHVLFLSAANSEHNQDVLKNPEVQLIFSNPSDNEFLSIYGRATVSKNKEKIDRVWDPMDKAWFPNGKDDVNLTVIEVFPEDAYYWTSEDGKILSMAKILTSALTGSKMDGGVEGHLNL